MCYVVDLQIQAGMDRSLKYLAAFAALYAGLALFFLRNYLSPASLHLQLGLAALLFTVRIDRSGTGSHRYGIAAVLSLLLLYCIPVKTFMYLSIAMALAFAIESFAGKLNTLPLFVLIFMSPVFDFMANMFSFPIRLSITAFVGNVMTLCGMHAAAEGNVIVLDGNEFSVDPACMGLSMLTASLLAGCMLIALWSKTLSFRLPVFAVIAALAGIVLLNLLSNLARILILVIFRVLPETVMHDVIGLSCFLLYQLLPAAWLTRLLVKRFGKPVMAVVGADKRRRLWPNTFLALLTVAMLIIAGQYDNKKPALTASLPGYNSETVSGNVLKLSNSKVLIYIKPILGFYASEHHPMICWNGSGYQFKKVSVGKRTTGDVYQGQLEKGKEVLYTAWWYDNGSLSTTSQVEWRWCAMRTKREFMLVNITASSPAELEKQIACFRQARIMRCLLSCEK